MITAALASGAESTVSLRVRAIGSGSAIATATVASNITDPAQGNNSDPKALSLSAQTFG